MEFLAFLLAVLTIVLQIILLIAVWRLAAAVELIARNYNAECHAMTKAAEQQAESIKALAEHLKGKA